MSIVTAPAISRRGTPTPPSFRSNFGNTGTSISSISGTIPSGAQIGDIAIAVICAEGLTFNTPTGWKKLDSRLNAGYPQRGTVYSKTLISGDPSSSVTWTGTGSATTIILCGAVYQGAADVGVAAMFTDNPLNPAQDGGASVRIGAVDAGPQDLIVLFGANKTYLSADANTPQLSSAGPGFTIRDNRGANAPIQFGYGAYICDGAASNAMVDPTPSLQGQSWNMGGALTLTPTGRRPTLKLPSTLQGAALHVYGESLTCYVGPPATSGVGPWFSNAIWPERLGRQMGAVGTLAEENNLGMPGGYAQEIAGFAFGTVSYPTRSVYQAQNYLPQSGTWMSMANRSGLVIVEPLGNDVLNYRATANSATQAKAFASVVNSTDAMVRLLRASSYIHDDDGSLTYAGTWAASTTANDAGGGKYRQSTTPGSTVTFTTTQTDIDLIVLAIDDANAGAAGANYEVRVGGSLVASGDLSNQCKMSQGVNGNFTYNHSPYCQKAIPLRGMAAGSKTIELKHTGASGELLRFDGYLVASTTPPWIVLNKLPHFNPVVYSTIGLGGSNDDCDTFSAICDTVAAQFSDGKVLVFDPLDQSKAAGVWDYTTMSNTVDYVHLEDAGAAFYHRAICKLLQESVA